jgi:hypothetical protein
MSCLAVMGTDQSTRRSAQNQSQGWPETTGDHVATAHSAVRKREAGAERGCNLIYEDIR